MPRSLLFATLLAFSIPTGEALARKHEPAAKPAPDAHVAAQLKALDYKYEVDEDGDFRLVFDVDSESKRNQLVFIRSAVETYGELKIREIWSPGYAGSGEQLPQAVANRLLEASMANKLGGWGKQGNNAVFIIRLPADADQEALDTALTAAIHSADEMEAELTPGKDEL
ncbi:hypothetical protein EBB59_00445 [Lysobacter pythonis]|uniref:Uncharacterized protein n=1 Tax=Solilutibacter pythonis TaxID=2483112 RepID=A0A3M2HYJ5_9GAMM|nr:hypothetical protein [Lysobacter pythonis]RMH94801.1 hypothetical protein EBB59_00445 [Lysobacter pythonis]